MNPNNSIKNNLRYSIIEGSFWAFMFGMGENYLSALSVFLGYTAFQITLLSSIPQFIGSFCQLFSNKILMIVKSKKIFVVVLSYLHAFLWIFLIFIIFYINYYIAIMIWLIIYFVISSLITPVWVSWIGYIVPKRIRGTYHGVRNRNINFFILIAILLGGYILDSFDENLKYGFLILFIIAFIGRLISSYYLNKKSETPEDMVNIDTSFKYLLNDKTRLFFFNFKILINFAIMFLGSLFAIYILRTLEMSNLILGFCGTTWWAGNISSSKYWGKFSKVHGYVYILKISIISLTILPISWIFVYYAGDPYKVFIILFTSFIAGITFSGFSLSTFNLVYEIVNKEDVVKYTSILRFGEGIGILFASIMAGYLVDSIYINNFLSTMNFSSVQLSIFISMILRCFCLVFFIKNKNLFKV